MPADVPALYRLKDSDVTWLYGPLHIGSDWSKAAHKVPPPSPALPRRQNSIDGSRPATPSAVKKPILKRRSISQLLSLPASPFFTGDGSEDEDADDAAHHGDGSGPIRPPLMHTKSDTHISWRSRPFRKESPPRIIAPDLPEQSEHLTTPSATTTSSDSTDSSQDLTTAASITGADGAVQGKKKHISFNTFVEQFIAIEKPKPKRKPGAVYFSDPAYDDGSVETSFFFLGG